MIKYIILALGLSAQLAFAQQNTLNVYIPFAVGSTTDATCRTLFDAYGAENNVKIVAMNHTGGDQVVGHQAFIKSTEPALFCAGNGIIFNQVHKKEIAPPLNTLKPVTDVLKLSHFILTPESGPNTLDAVVERSKRTGKPVLVGAPALTSSKVLVYALEKMGAKYEVVVYRKPQEAIVSLKDGSLDTYVDGGSIKMIEGVTGIKEIAHASITGDKSTTENLIKRWPEIENITSMTIIYARATTPDAEVEKYSRQLRKTINGATMKEYFKTNVPFHNVVPTTPKQSQEKAQRLLNYLNAQQ
jgi:tripartite-type tricarboxylate transporter receptor subunit TctC